ncbi:MAG: hypothetical protein AVDCRST_MAG66-646, partial [uncultured Pseudonocardia sp.]
SARSARCSATSCAGPACPGSDPARPRRTQRERPGCG